MTTATQITASTGSESCNTMDEGSSDVKTLQASLAASNNGYLFAPTPREIRVAKEHPLFFVVSGGLIYGRGQNPQQYAGAPEPQRQLVVDGPDYEALILARQECDGFYD